MNSLKKLVSSLRKLEFRRYMIVYLMLILTVVVAGGVLIMKPDIERGDGWVGVRVHQSAKGGFLTVVEVIPGSPADAVGVAAGDKILSFKGFPIYDIATFKHLVHESYIRELTRIVLDRNGSRLTADTRITKRPEHAGILPIVISVERGTLAPHKPRGICLKCHNITPPRK